MDVDLQPEEEGREKEEEEDYFLKFIDHAMSELLENEGDPDPNGDGAIIDQPGWSWIVSRILKTCVAYSSGVTPAILLSELSLAWSEQRRVGAPTKKLEFIKHLKKNHRRMKLPNAVTIDSIYEKNFLSLNSVLEAVIVDAFVIPGTSELKHFPDYWVCLHWSSLLDCPEICLLRKRSSHWDTQQRVGKNTSKNIIFVSDVIIFYKAYIKLYKQTCDRAPALGIMQAVSDSNLHC